MAKTFNATELCIPEKHYMVDLGERIRQIRKMVDRGDYFCINHARQYGKTTTLADLAKALDKEYLLSFNFNQKKQIGIHEMIVGGKVLIEAVV